MRYLIAFICILIYNQQAQSQIISLSGFVCDANTKEMLVNANICIKNASIGCIANAEGIFQFKVSNEYLDSTLQISFIGYQSYEKKICDISKDELKIGLVPLENELPEVAVKPPNPVEIFVKVLQNLKNNYWQQPVNSNAFYREILFQDNKAKRLSEAACEFYIEPFSMAFDGRKFNASYYKTSSYEALDNAIYLDVCQFAQPVTNQVKIIESRSSFDISNTGIEFGISGGPILPLSYDGFNMGWYSLKESYEKSCEHYDYLKDLTVSYSTYQGKPIYILKGKSYTYYIDRESYAIIQYSYQYVPYLGTRKISQVNKRIKKYKSNKDLFSLDTLMVDIRYFPWKGKWYYKSISARQYFTYIPYKGDSIKLHVEKDLMFTDTKTSNAQPFADSLCFKNRINSTLYSYATSYNPDFWEDYNSLCPTNLQKSIKESLEEAIPLNAQYEAKFDYDENLPVPVAKKIPDTLFINEQAFPDDYSWFESGSEDSVINYIRKENRYADNYFAKFTPLVRELSNEITNKYKLKPFIAEDEEWHQKIGNYNYYMDTIGKYAEGLFRVNASGEIDTLIDEKESKRYIADYGIRWISASPDDAVFCYNEYTYADPSLDYQLVFKEVKKDTVIQTIKSLTCKWLTDSTYLNIERVDGSFFNRRLYYRNLYTQSSKLLYQSGKDKAIWYKESSSGDYVFLSIGSLAGTDSIFYIKKDEELPKLKLLVAPDSPKVYDIDHFKGEKTIYLCTNQFQANFELYSINPEKTDFNDWEKIITSHDYNELRLVGKVDSLLVLSSLNGISKDLILYTEHAGKYINLIQPDDHFYTMSLVKVEADSTLILKYETYLSPCKYYSYTIKGHQLTYLGEDVYSNYDAGNYKVKKEECMSSDGTVIPVILLSSKKVKGLFQKAPLLIETYGGGNLEYNPSFRTKYLPLLDRGFVVAFALVRGSAELGTAWVDKALHKNVAISGDDVGDVANFLIDAGVTKPDRLFAYGSSHGGFVMSFVANKYPGLFKGIIVDVPAGDLLNTLSDSASMTTRFDYNIYGSPYVEEELRTLVNICPYQNIKAQNYPNMLFLAGLLDVNTNPITAVKHVAKLRELKTDNNNLLLRVLMNSGHSAEGGKYVTEQAWIYTFMMKCIDSYK